MLSTFVSRGMLIGKEACERQKLWVATLNSRFHDARVRALPLKKALFSNLLLTELIGLLLILTPLIIVSVRDGRSDGSKD